jgi:glutamyl-tRNA reductase
LADHYGVRALALAGFLELAERGDASGHWDGVLFAVDSDQPIFFPRHARGLEVEVVVDISMPSVLDRSLASVPGLEVIDLDGIARLVQAESARRESKYRLAESLVSGRARTLHQLVVEADAKTGLHLSRIPAIHLENAMEEFEAVLTTRLSHLSDQDKDTVRRLLHKTVKRNAHLHLKDVRELCSARAVNPTRHRQRGQAEPAMADSG